ncbi:MAG TPA: S1 RNA-binding domain-containing protein [Chloroflexota bacterium]|nr:S1 RNA-binding domain-containing protein [Chloroflexota bacterium]
MEDIPGNQWAGEIGSTEDPPEDMQSLMEAQEAGFRSLHRGQTTKGTVVSIADDAVLVDVGLKSEGIIRREELVENGDDLPDLHLGQEVFVQVLQPDSPSGPILSLRRARREQTWVDAQELAQTGGMVEGPVVEFNRGGAVLEIRGVRGFVPLSQLVSLPPAGQGEGEDTERRLSELIGRRLRVKVLEANRQQNRLILSERAAVQEERAKRRAALLEEIRVGDVRRGVVRNVTNFGAFVDLGGADGLVHVSEISYERVTDPRSVLQPGQEVDVYVLDVRPEDQKISLSLKRAVADPWDSIDMRYQPGENVQATIVRLAKFGAFAQVEPGVEGLIHVSELADVAPRDPGQVLHEGQVVEAKIIHMDKARRRLGLSIRQAQPTVQEMTAEEWSAAQDRELTPVATAFDALAGLNESLAAEDLTDESLPADRLETADDRLDAVDEAPDLQEQELQGPAEAEATYGEPAETTLEAPDESDVAQATSSVAEADGPSLEMGASPSTQLAEEVAGARDAPTGEAVQASETDNVAEAEVKVVDDNESLGAETASGPVAQMEDEVKDEAGDISDSGTHVEAGPTSSMDEPIEDEAEEAQPVSDTV